jgi:hypothetical protein
MQPYLFPYIGYFQLIKAVDKFIVYDEANYIKRGWVNRNYLMIGNKRYLFSLPLKKASQSKSIKNTEIDACNYPTWKMRFLKTITHYSKSPYYTQVRELIESGLDAAPGGVADFNLSCLVLVCKYLGVETILAKHSEAYGEKVHRGQDQIIHICKIENADSYINPIGGLQLYSKQIFSEHRINLLFLKSGQIRYRQFSRAFEPGLSIIDVMMFNSIEEINLLLDNYELI